MISIIVPAYNVEKYISRCLDSIINQNYKDIEIIVVNDGSTDRTGKIIDAYSKKDRRVISIHKENGGVATARNTGIKLAKGGYIGFVDSDDEIAPNMYEVLLKNMELEHAQLSNCGHRVVMIDGTIKDIHGTKEKIICNGEKFTKLLLEGTFVESTMCSKLYITEIVRQLSMDTSIFQLEDLYFNYLYCQKIQMSVLEDLPLYIYYKRDNSNSADMSEKAVKSVLKIAECLISELPKDSKLLQLAKEKRLLIYIVQYRGLTNINKLATMRSEIRSKIKEYRHDLKPSYFSKVGIISGLIAYCPLVLKLIDRFRK